MIRGYDFIWRLARPLLPLMLAWRARSGKEDAARLTERFGRYDHRADLPDAPLWIHAVSVGSRSSGTSPASFVRSIAWFSTLVMRASRHDGPERCRRKPAIPGRTRP